MPIKYYYLNKPLLCIKNMAHISDSSFYPRYGEIYTVRDVVMVDGAIVGFLFHEIRAMFGYDAESYFLKSSFVLVYKSMLNDADSAIRELIQPLRITIS